MIIRYIFLDFYRKANKAGGDAQNKKITPATQLAGKSIKPAEQVPRLQLEEKIQECLVKEETIQVRRHTKV